MKSTIGSDTVKLTSSKLITMSVSFITVMVLTRYLTLEEFGTYTQLLLIINIITTLFIMGLPNSINYFLARAESVEEQQKFLGVYYSLSTLLSFLTGLILVVLTPIYIGFFDNPLLYNFIYFFAIFPWAKIILSSIDHVLIVYQKTTYLLLFRLTNSLLLLSIVVTASLLNLSFSIYILLFLIVESLLAFCVYIIVKEVAGKIKLNFDINLIKKIFKFSVPIGLASVVGMLSIQLDKIVISQFYSTEDLAIYANAARELPIAIVASSLTAVLMPQMVRMLKRNQYIKTLNLWGNAIYISYTIICFFVVAIIIFAPEVITLLYSEKYLDGVLVFQIYSLVLLLRFTYFGLILNSIGKTKIILYSSIVSLLINFSLNYIFYFLFGFIGPAIATFITIFSLNLFQLIFTSKVMKVSFGKVFPWKNLMNISIVNIFIGFGIWNIKIYSTLDLYIGGIGEALVLGIIWLLIYMIIMKRNVVFRWSKLSN